MVTIEEEIKQTRKFRNPHHRMVVNIMYTGIYLYKELYLYAILFAIYFVLAVIGYKTWKKMC